MFFPTKLLLFASCLLCVARTGAVSNEENKSLNAETKTNLRAPRNLASNGPCNSGQFCTELYEPGSRFQAFSDGFCNRYNQCNGYSTQNCVCRPNGYAKPNRNYVFEQASRNANIQAYNPYNLPSMALERFDDNEHQTQVSPIVDGYENDARELATYSLTIEDTAIVGRLAIDREGVVIPPGFSEGRLSTYLLMGFRVLRSGTYKVKVSFDNDLHQSNYFDIDIEDDDYHPDWTRADKQLVRFATASSGNELEKTFELQAGHTFTMDIGAAISGETGTAITWRVEFEG